MEIKVPLGSWSLQGEWSPNYLLAMPPREQYESNLRNGYAMKCIEASTLTDMNIKRDLELNTLLMNVGMVL